MEPNTTVNGLLMLPAAKVLSLILTETYTLAIGAIVKLTVRVFIKMQLALDMKGSGKMTNNMVKESKVGQTEHFTKEIML
mgnify:CR=1 FL=1